MIELRRWIETTHFEEKPWLILGKGPTFSQRHRFDLAAYNLLALNHVVRELNVEIAHAIDIDVVVDCGMMVADNARWLLMPRRPHRRSVPGALFLEDYLDEIPVLRFMDGQGRLVWYSAATAPHPGSPTIGVRWFSSEAALNILAHMGVRRVRSLGVDGGTTYSDSFRDLTGKTLLVNTQPSFDRQFEGIKAIVDRTGIDYEPLVEPIRVFVGCDDSQMVAARVLEHTIRKHASRPVEFTAMIDMDVPVPKDKANRARTGFSFYRFLIPKLCGYKGRAVYLDSDMQVFTDMAELWEIPFGEQKILCTYQDEPPQAWKDSTWFHPGRQMSVMLLDCERLPWDIEEIVRGLDEGAFTYEDLMFEMCLVEPDEIGDTIPPEWNSLEHYEPGKTKLLHYTVVPTQPWKNDDNQLRDVWLQDFHEAVSAGAVPVELVRASIAGGHIKPSLLNDVAVPPPPARPGGRGPFQEISFRVGRRLKTTPGTSHALRWGWRALHRLKRIRTPR